MVNSHKMTTQDNTQQWTNNLAITKWTQTRFRCKPIKIHLMVRNCLNQNKMAVRKVQFQKITLGFA